MKIKYYKYHALLNDFILIASRPTSLTSDRLSKFARNICHRKRGIGADGVLYLKRSKKGVWEVDVYNADGGWAEKSGNGLRIAGLHCYRTNQNEKDYLFQMGGTLNKVSFINGSVTKAKFSTELGVPKFQTKDIPINMKSRFMINQPLKIGGVSLPMTCLSIGNPHTVLFVEDFDFDWKHIGLEIEKHRLFPNHTNVEFVRILSRKRLQLAEWERGVGATGSSGTGAAASVAAAVVLGVADRKCRVEFDSGALLVHWRKSDNIIELAGPVAFIGEGEFEFK